MTVGKGRSPKHIHAMNEGFVSSWLVSCVGVIGDSTIVTETKLSVRSLMAKHCAKCLTHFPSES